MRLFLLGTLLVAVFASGCPKEESPPAAGALRVSISYATFQPQCLTLTVVDQDAPSRTDSTQVQVVPGVRSDTRTVAILGREGWSRNLRLTATAHERSCNGALVAEQSADAQVPVVGVTEVGLALRAEDLDDDTFITAEGPRPGTDCDDANPAVNPLATEQCDGIDNNCRNGEGDAPGARNYYPDRDADGYGDSSVEPIPSCVPPASTATQGGDCDDNDATIRPGQQESRCDGEDDDCDGVVDDDAFAVGATCMTAQACPGVNTCQGVSAVTCVSAQQPVEWYVDADGDGSAGAAAGLWCTEPEQSATTTRSDCDESSRYASNVATEVCDRLDNDCDEQVDEDLADCATTEWTETTVGGAATWNAVAPYGGNRGWLAGEGGLVTHVNGDIQLPVMTCPGNWKAAWVASNGRVFLGSGAGRLATVLPAALDTCAEVAGVATSSINGLVGFEDGTTVRLFAVDSQGRIIRWEYVEGAQPQAAPVLVTQLAANLRAIHGLSPETLLVVGQENGTTVPSAWSAPASGGTWPKENLGSTGTTGYLRAVRVLTPRLAYAAGDGGLLMERSGGAWTVKPQLTVAGSGAVNVRALLAFGRTALYAVGSGPNEIHFFNGTTWSSVAEAPGTLNALEATGPGDLWGVGFTGTLVRWQP
ncbi:putative metal-binding motif-containing protein [Pyxidicoccus trucidator]|uniref:putative metal-binding motif-containing protein n=1 Tax=Pyxidicoccus trucidator TaxID=2709662 RepID=UPI0013DA34DF|nr:putative metal-binding motif-containing protein [Pyxidicoccus trucidator]